MKRNKRIALFTLILLLLLIILPLSFTDQINHKVNDTNIKSESASTALQNNSIPSQPAKIMIDPGHGGIDSGVDIRNVRESDITLDISKKLKSYLEKKSFSVEMSRSTDISLYKLSNIVGTIQKRELTARTDLINKSGADIFVSIHVNSYPEYPDMSGSIVYYNLNMPKSKELSESIQKQLNSISIKNFKRGTHDPQEADFYLLENSSITGILIETAFITNSTEYNLIQQDEYKSKISMAVADGIEEYLK